MEDALIAAFPYPPYDIQLQFMRNAYEVLEQKQIGLFESPTGTGKTLSVICSTLTWLEHHHRKNKEEAAAAAAAAAAADDALPDWLLAGAALEPEPAAGRQQRPQLTQQRRKQPRQAKPAVLDEDGIDLSEFLLDNGTGTSPGSEPTAAAAGAKRAAPDIGYSDSDSADEADAAAAAAAGEAAAQAAASERRRPQVIFCSRTHSQLSQFVGELHRTRFADSIQLVAVGSRKALCVNEQVQQLPELSQVNERCLELQRSKAAAPAPASTGSNKRQAGPRHTSSGGGRVVGLTRGPAKAPPRRKARAAGCPFLSPVGGASAWEDLREMVLAAPMDVEELGRLGRKQQVCPYYGSRRAVPGADVVLAPYSAVLMPDARGSLGIELQDAVLVFDEAHNLLDAINSAHSTAVSAWQLLSVQRSFSAYYERFKAFLNPTNASNLQQLLHIAAALHKCLPQQRPGQQQQQPPSHGCAGSPGGGSSTSTSTVLAVNDLLFDLGLDNINMLQLARWVRDNKMAFKVSGYTAAAVAKAGGSIDLQQPAAAAAAAATGAQQEDAQAAAAAGGAAPPSGAWRLSARDGVSAIHAFTAFLLSLTQLDADGRIVVEPAPAAAAAAAHAAGAAASAALAPAAGRAGPQHGGSAEQQQLSSQQQQVPRGGRLRYVLLNAARHFGALLASARAVLLVSGTLAPVEGLAAQLFPGIPPPRIRHFECGHVVQPSQLLALSVGRGPSGRALRLTAGGRAEAATMDELGQLLLNVCGLVPQGCVVFVPSFSYLEQLTERWRATGLWQRLAQRKQVFREPRAASEVDAVLEAYAAAICGSDGSSGAAAAGAAAAAAAAAAGAGDALVAPSAPGTAAVQAHGSNTAGVAAAAGPASCVGPEGGSGAAAPPAPRGGGRGALMLCVVGGKLSEGINFGDGLGRCVVMVGLPYPNPTDVELQERMRYLDTQAAAPAAAAAGQSVHDATGQEASPPSQQQQQQQQHTTAPAPDPAARSAFRIINQAGHHLGGGGSGLKQTGGGSKPAAPAAVCQPAQAPSQHAAAAAAGSGGGQARAADAAHAADADGGAIDAGGGEAREPCVLTGRAYYEDLCFKAVNQCVGRVVRHSGDHAAVVLLDTRWVVGPAEWAASSGGGSSGGGSTAQPGRKLLPVQKLPGWLQRAYVPTDGGFGAAVKQLAAFYRRQQTDGV